MRNMRRFNIHPSINCTSNNAMTSCAQFVQRTPLQLTWLIERFHISPFVIFCSLLLLTNAHRALNVNFLFSLYGLSFLTWYTFVHVLLCTPSPLYRMSSRTKTYTNVKHHPKLNACSESGMKNVSPGALCVECGSSETKEMYARVKSHLVFVGSVYHFCLSSSPKRKPGERAPKVTLRTQTNTRA